jgi:transcriptional regulator with XRE-family HTH domain
MGRNRSGEATWAARMLRTEVGREIREARLAGGVSLRTAAGSVGLSHSQLGRIERAELPNVSIEQLCRACASVGLRFAGRAYPHGDPVRDHAQLALIARFRARLSDRVRVRVEVPLPIERDPRAWDLVLALEPEPAAVEAETRLRDLQALQRRVALKQRDGGISCVILLVNDTPANRRILALHAADVRAAFPLSGREVLAVLDRGRTPPANGVVML